MQTVTATTEIPTLLLLYFFVYLLLKWKQFSYNFSWLLILHILQFLESNTLVSQLSSWEIFHRDCLIDKPSIGVNYIKRIHVVELTCYWVAQVNTKLIKALLYDINIPTKWKKHQMFKKISMNNSVVFRTSFFAKYRIIRPEVFCKKSVLKIFTKFTWKPPALGSLFE